MNYYREKGQGRKIKGLGNNVTKKIQITKIYRHTSITKGTKKVFWLTAYTLKVTKGTWHITLWRQTNKNSENTVCQRKKSVWL